MRSASAWLIGIPAVLLALGGGVWLGAANQARIAQALGATHAGPAPEQTMLSTDAASAGAGLKKDRKVLYWTDPMYNPPYISDKPGKSPMGMDLLPVYEDEVAAGTGVTVDPVIVQNMGVRVAQVTEGDLNTTIRAVGTLTEPEQNHLEINLHVSGWIQKLYANIEGMQVTEGEPLFDLYSPELIAASDELITARKTLDAIGAAGDDTVRSSSQSILAAARRKLSLAGLTVGQIDAIAKSDLSPTTFAFLAPKTGHVAEKMVVEGSAVKAGDRVMVIADRSTMWLQLQIFERQLAMVPPGTIVHATFAAVPGETMEGKVEFIYPHLDPATRTAKVRVVLPNQDHRLHEGMYANVDIDVLAGAAVRMVPREAVIDSGTRQIVFISEGNGHFSPRQVTVGAMGHVGGISENDDMIQVLTGLGAGETVVTSGQFLLDSESRTQEAIQKHLAEHLLARQDATPAATTPAPAAASAAAPTPASDSLLKAYLEAQRQLSSEPTAAIDPQLLIKASADFESQATDDSQRALAARLTKASSALRQQPLEDQRVTFKTLSQAIIELTGIVRVSTSVSPALFQFHCPMTDGDWLQSSAEIANPFGGEAMKTCGSLTRTIAAAPASPEGARQ